ncbi:MAG: NAD kinase [Bacteroidales bacterium]|nr:NAD kinase [Bacteroidales bacterium]
MKIIIYGRSFRKEYSEKIGILFDLLHQKNVEIIVYEKFYKLIKSSIKKGIPISVFSSIADFPEKAHFLISLGGDGTFLETITFVRDSNIPVIGINLGRLGFLAHIAENEIELAINAILSKQYIIEERSLIKLESEPSLFPDFPYALNEITFQKKDSSLITIHTYIDNHFLNSYWADGLIISTPTGSTAYSMSVGGPILTPGSQNFIISPIAPHTLTVRPLVIPNTSILSFTIEGRSKNFITSLDSRFITCTFETKLKVELAPFSIKMVNLSKHEFFNTIRNKLMWGVDRRN